MRSSSTSNSNFDSASSEGQLIARVDHLSLVFKTQNQKPWTSLKDIFVEVVTDPVGFLLAEVPRLTIARDISFDIRAGDRIGIMGLNGVGKTSICRCIAGMYSPSAGKISVYGKLRAVFDTSVGIQPELTGRENANLIGQFMYPGETGMKELIAEALEFSELGHFLDTPYKFYSNGMQARLSLSLVSCKPCDLLILDEVFDGADVFFREKVARRVLGMIKKSGAVLFVSHSPEQIVQVCNRVLILSAGAIIYDGDVEAGIRFFRELDPRFTGPAEK